MLVLLGILGGKPKLSYPPALNKPVAEFSIAINRVWKDEAGAKHEDTEWRHCKAFGKTAELITQSFNQGDPILITDARLKTESWVGHDGAKNTLMTVIVGDFKFIKSKNAKATS